MPRSFGSQRWIWGDWWSNRLCGNSRINMDDILVCTNRKCIILFVTPIFVVVAHCEYKDKRHIGHKVVVPAYIEHSK